MDENKIKEARKRLESNIRYLSWLMKKGAIISRKQAEHNVELLKELVKAYEK
jgi:hypothetical protein